MLLQSDRLTVLSQESTEMEDTNKSISRCLDYLLTFSNGTINFTASDMVLWVHSDGAYLVEDGTNSRAGGHCFLSDFVKDI